MKIPLEVKKQGLYCPAGNFFIDAWSPVPLCLITHAHGDHAYFGHESYIASQDSLELLHHCLGPQISFKTYPYGQKFKLNNCWVSFHPAGHILGSSQIRIEVQDTVSVISGDYKRAYDKTCEPFEIVECDLFVSESTFALPIYNWEPSEVIAKKIYAWWQENRALGLCSVLFCYALGKAQRILALLEKFTEEPIYVHGAILPLSEIYAKKGITLGKFLPITEKKDASFSKDLILAPPIARGSTWLRRFYPYKTALASGWMALRGMRKQRNVDTGFVLSDHADWPDLLSTISQTEASIILTTHGNTHTLARYLQEQGLEALPLQGLETIEEEAD